MPKTEDFFESFPIDEEVIRFLAILKDRAANKMYLIREETINRMRFANIVRKFNSGS
jgi:hypothetical protein